MGDSITAIRLQMHEAVTQKFNLHIVQLPPIDWTITFSIKKKELGFDFNDEKNSKTRSRVFAIVNKGTEATIQELGTYLQSVEAELADEEKLANFNYNQFIEEAAVILGRNHEAIIEAVKKELSALKSALEFESLAAKKLITKGLLEINDALSTIVSIINIKNAMKESENITKATKSALVQLMTGSENIYDQLEVVKNFLESKEGKKAITTATSVKQLVESKMMKQVADILKEEKNREGLLNAVQHSIDKDELKIPQMQNEILELKKDLKEAKLEKRRFWLNVRIKDAEKALKEFQDYVEGKKKALKAVSKYRDFLIKLDKVPKEKVVETIAEILKERAERRAAKGK